MTGADGRTALTLLAVVSVGLGAAAQLLLKTGAGRLARSGGVAEMAASAFNAPLVGGLALYGASAVLWILVLARLDLSYAYPFVGLSFVIVTALAWALLGEQVPPLRVAGCALIALGCLLVARGG